jgi:hypothetical protein
MAPPEKVKTIAERKAIEYMRHGPPKKREDQAARQTPQIPSLQVMLPEHPLSSAKAEAPKMIGDESLDVVRDRLRKESLKRVGAKLSQEEEEAAERLLIEEGNRKRSQLVSRLRGTLEKDREEQGIDLNPQVGKPRIVKPGKFKWFSFLRGGDASDETMNALKGMDMIDSRTRQHLDMLVNQADEVTFTRKVVRAVKDKDQLVRAEQRLRKYQERPHPLGAGGLAGLASDSMLVDEHGLRIYHGKPSKDDARGTGVADVRITFDDIASGAATIDVAPTQMQPVATLIKKAMGKRIPRTVVVHSGGNEYKIVGVENAEDLVDACKTGARPISRRNEIEERLQNLQESDAAQFRKTINQMNSA